jgi:hypothetical protein
LTALGPATAEFSGAQILSVRGPVVYAWCRGDEALYIGCSKNGLVRPFHPFHSRLKEVQHGDTVRIWRMASMAAATAQEDFLVRALRPKFNTLERGRPRGLHRPLEYGEVLVTVSEAARRLCLKPKTVLNMLSANRDMFVPKQYRRRQRVLTEDEVRRLTGFISVRVK